MPKLSVLNGLQKGTEVPVTGPLVIGRGASADVSLPDSGVSRRHASLTLRDGEWYVEDLNSANGTEVNGVRLQQATRLREGDVIGVGSVFVEFSRRDVPRSDAAPIPEVKIQDEGPSPAVLFSIPEDQRPSSAADDKARLRFLDDVARISTLVFDEPALVSFIVEEMLELMPRADRAAVLIDQGGELVPRAARTRSGATPTLVMSRSLLRDVMAKREAVLAVNTATDARFAESQSIHAMGIRAAICAPILFQQELYGVLQVDSATSGVPFNKADLALVLSLASQVGMALGYARLHARLVKQQIVEHDMALARKIQQAFLPDSGLNRPGYELSVEYRPALAVGGDLYDVIDVSDGRIALIVADVSGKGVSAALFAAKLTTDLRYQAIGQSEPAEILRRANQVLARRDNEGMFATAGIAVLDPATGAIEVASAGHPLPLVRDRSGAVDVMGRTGDRPLGLDPKARYSQSRYEMETGDTVVMFTDGVIEALDPANQLYGDERLVAVLRATRGEADAIRRAVDTDVAKFVAGAPQSDDVTIMCLTRSAS